MNQTTSYRFSVAYPPIVPWFRGMAPCLPSVYATGCYFIC